MKPARALAVFTVCRRDVRVRVRLLPSVADVDAAFRDGAPRRSGRRVHAFFVGSTLPQRLAGTITLPARGRLAELIPHEVVHAVVHHGSAAGDDDEELALAVGLLSGAIATELRRRGIEVTP